MLPTPYFKRQNLLLAWSSKWDWLSGQQAPCIWPPTTIKSASITRMPTNWLDVGSVGQVQVFRIVWQALYNALFPQTLQLLFISIQYLFQMVTPSVTVKLNNFSLLSHHNYEILSRLDSEITHDQCNSLFSLYDSNNPLNQI